MARLNSTLDSLEESLQKMEKSLKRTEAMMWQYFFEVYGQDWEEVKGTPMVKSDTESTSKSNTAMDAQQDITTEKDVSSFTSVSCGEWENAPMTIAEEVHKKNNSKGSTMNSTSAPASLAVIEDEQAYGIMRAHAIVKDINKQEEQSIVIADEEPRVVVDKESCKIVTGIRIVSANKQENSHGVSGSDHSRCEREDIHKKNMFEAIEEEQKGAVLVAEKYYNKEIQLLKTLVVQECKQIEKLNQLLQPRLSLSLVQWGNAILFPIVKYLQDVYEDFLAYPFSLRRNLASIDSAIGQNNCILIASLIWEKFNIWKTFGLICIQIYDPGGFYGVVCLFSKCKIYFHSFPYLEMVSKCSRKCCNGSFKIELEFWNGMLAILHVFIGPIRKAKEEMLEHKKTNTLFLDHHVLTNSYEVLESQSYYRGPQNSEVVCQIC